MDLSELFHDLPIDVRTHGDVASVEVDSRAVRPGALFFAIAGEHFDGRKYLADAERQGAVCAVADRKDFDPALLKNISIPVHLSDDARGLLSYCARRFYAPDVNSLLNVGVTGTNGKSSVTWIIAQALSRLGKRALYAGTLGIRLFERGSEIWRHETSLTTAGPIEFFQAVAEAQPDVVVAEVSSHAIAQRRLSAMSWDASVFTNLTRDHLDYHRSFEAYGETKARLFTETPVDAPKKQTRAIINRDDEWGQKIGRRVADPFFFSPSGNAGAPMRIVRSNGNVTGTHLVWYLLKRLARFRHALSVITTKRMCSQRRRRSLRSVILLKTLRGYLLMCRPCPDGLNESVELHRPCLWITRIRRMR